MDMTNVSAGIKEGLFDADVVAEYLLWTLNRRVEMEAGMAECDPKRRESRWMEVEAIQD